MAALLSWLVPWPGTACSHGTARSSDLQPQPVGVGGASQWDCEGLFGDARLICYDIWEENLGTIKSAADAMGKSPLPRVLRKLCRE